MKRKKWTEAEEKTLIGEYSGLLSSGALAKLRTREKKFQPIADRVNSLHHLRDPATFSFLWSWRDVSIKIQNMRHQYLGVKQKVLLHRRPSPSSAASDLDWDHGVNLWPNFLCYKQVFGDLDLDLDIDASRDHPATTTAAAVSELELDFDGEEEEEIEEEVGLAANDVVEAEMEGLSGGEDPKSLVNSSTNAAVLGLGLHDQCCRTSSGVSGGRLGLLGRRVVELGKIAMRREENRRGRPAAREEEDRSWERRRRVKEHRREMEAAARLRWEEDSRARWRRREERREEEEMEWRERVLVMQMEHEKQMMQMHADACQVQMQMLGILGRLACQFVGPSSSGSDSGLGGLPNQELHNLQPQHQQHSPGALVGDDGKNDAHSSEHYL